jgi:succinate dehydrogenase / fumarate reductase cytochrome b subunit
MTLLGTLLLIFLVIHMADFWLHTKKALYITHEEENPYLQVKAAMQNPLLLVIYIAGFFSLGFHLLHGFPSAFQTLGLNHKKYTPIIKAVGTAFSIVVPGLFAAIALALFFGLV